MFRQPARATLNRLDRQIICDPKLAPLRQRTVTAAVKIAEPKLLQLVTFQVIGQAQGVRQVVGSDLDRRLANLELGLWQRPAQTVDEQYRPLQMGHAHLPCQTE